MSKGKISAKQLEILEYIKSQILERGFPPAVREICEAVNLKSTSSVHSHLETLEKNGYIHRDPTKPRAIEILDDDFNLNRREMVNIPIVGRVAAVVNIDTDQHIVFHFVLLLHRDHDTNSISHPCRNVKRLWRFHETKFAAPLDKRCGTWV